MWKICQKHGKMNKGGDRMERAFSGYCRAIDAARVVLCECEKEDRDIGCGYETCEYAASCPVGTQITAFLKEAE